MTNNCRLLLAYIAYTSRKKMCLRTYKNNRPIHCGYSPLGYVTSKRFFLKWQRLLLHCITIIKSTSLPLPKLLNRVNLTETVTLPNRHQKISICEKNVFSNLPYSKWQIYRPKPFLFRGSKLWTNIDNVYKNEEVSRPTGTTDHHLQKPKQKIST